MKEELEIIKKEKNNVNIRNEEIIKNEKIKFAKESFEGSVILNEEEKIILSEWVDPKKPLKFNLVFSTKIDGSYASTKFHSNCDGVSPTIIIVKDTNGNNFGGYATSSWAQPTSGADYVKNTDAFIFSLSRKLNMFNLINLDKNQYIKIIHMVQLSEVAIVYILQMDAMAIQVVIQV